MKEPLQRGDATLRDLLLSLEGVHDVGPTFLGDDLTETSWSFSRLVQEAKSRAATLLGSGLRHGDTVALLLIDPLDFVPTFYACVLAGVVPVPMALPTSTRGIDGYVARCRQILKVAACRTLIISEQFRPLLGALNDADVHRIFSADELRGCPTDRSIEWGATSPDSPCFLQFTSGSTADPKGTVVTHANILANIKSIMVDGLKADGRKDVGFCWLPLFHDMGLVGFVIAPLLLRVPTVFLPTGAFVRRPALWMTLMSKYRATISFGPNFAFGLAARRAGDVSQLDLSCVRALGCGAEPINRRTLDDFIAAYSEAGLRPEVVMPAYGMAEATLAMSFDRLDRPFQTVRVDRHAFERERRADKAPETAERGVEFVSCGRPFPGHELRIVEDGQPLAEGHVGEIHFRGPSRTPGYVGRAPEGAWLATGDLGFILDDELFVCGRRKELIIVRGRKVHPYDVEWEVAQFGSVRAGSVVAFSVADRGQEHVVILVETKARDGDVPVDLIRGHLMDTLQLPAPTIVVVGKNTLPKTSSGKLQRGKTRELWLQGAFVKPSQTLLSDRSQSHAISGS